MSTVQGILIGLRQTLRVVELGLLYGGIPCASYSFMSSQWHRRSVLNPFGDETFGFVKMGNLLAARFFLLVIVAIARKVFWFVEQPGSSRLPLLPYCGYLSEFDTLRTNMVRW
jgi:hypothetical protein